MNVFGSDLAIRGDESLTDGVGAIVERLVLIPGPRSLCEIHADEEDYRWLCDWASRLTSFRLQGWLQGVNSRRLALSSSGVDLTFAEAAGCLLLLLASESARRNASEGRVWPTVIARFPEQTSRVLFAQGQPKGTFKDALEAVSRKLHLRHVFGIEGTQNYYISVYLQFGFTKLGLDRLPYWLAGHPSTQAISYLLGEGDGRLVSSSFVSFWNTLREYRKNNITKTRAQQILAHTPWTLPDWSDELIEQSGRHLELDAHVEEWESGDEQATQEFLELPRLQWKPPNPPRFLSSVVNLANFDLRADRYQIKAGSDLLATLLAGEMGSYFSHQREVNLPGSSSQLTASMVDDNGVVQASQLVKLWDASEDVQLVDLETGKRLDPYSDRLTQTRQYGLLISSDLDVEPPDLHFQEVGSGRDTKRLYLLHDRESRTVRVTLQGEEIWASPVIADTHPIRAEPNWARTVKTTVLPTEPMWLDRYIESSIRIAGIEDGCELRYVRFGGRPLDFQRGDGGDYLTEELDVTTDSSSWNSSGLPEVKVKLGLRRGNEPTVQVERTNILSVSGILRATDDRWQAVNGRDSITVAEAMQARYKVLLPGGAPAVDELALMEGPIFVRKLWRQPRPLGVLGGYGTPLEIRRPYNSEPGSQLVIANEVHDTGVLERVLVGDNLRIRLCLSHAVEPGPAHQIVVWNSGESAQVMSAAGIVNWQGDEWHAILPASYSEFDFVAIAYGGARIGTCWTGEPSLWSVVSSEDAALETAAMLKWMHAPIVAPNWLNAVRMLANRFPVPTLRAWLLDEGLPEGLVHEATDEHWRAAVRQVFSEWNPDSYSAWELIQALAGQSAEEPVSEALLALFREDPLLMGKIARQWMRSTDLPAVLSVKNKRELMESVRLLIAAVKDPEPQDMSPEEYHLLADDPKLLNEYAKALLNSAGSEDPVGGGADPFSQKEEELLRNASVSMGVDEYFLKPLVEQVTRTLDYNVLELQARRNAEAALTVAPFREYLGLRVLSSLVEEM